MKPRKIQIILVLILMLILCTSTVYAINPQNKYEFDDPNISYDEYLYYNNIGMNQKLTNLDIIGLLARKYDISLNEIQESTIIKCYYIDSYNTYELNRMQTLIDIMRLNLLIPDPDLTPSYSWTDIPKYITDQELAYINYAKELGITNGTGKSTFGFTQPITYSQFNTFILNIEKIKNLNQYQALCPITIIDKMNYNHEKLATPLIIEYFNTLPENLVAKFSDWTLYLDGYNIPCYDYAIGLTDSYNNTIDIVSLNKPPRKLDVIEVIVHEFGHAISTIANRRLVNGVYPDTNILEEEMPRLVKVYRSYAGENRDEYFACAWYWNYHVGDALFSFAYPYTYELFQSILDNYK